MTTIAARYVARGGSRVVRPRFLRSADRGAVPAIVRGGSLGFRLIAETKDPRNRVYRGGSWNLNPRHLRSAIRFRLGPDFRYNYLGFRLIAEPKS